MRSPKLAALELRRFSRGKLPRLGLVALTLIPLLYGALYLCSFWDPYSRLDKIPVALVNDDRGATTGGKEIHVGDELSENLKDSKKFHWEDVSAADAAKGVENGTYYLSLTVPKDFSKRIASSSGKTPQTGALKVRTNDANNYVVGSISKTVFSEVRAKTSAASSRTMLDKIFISFSDLHDKTADAADGAGKLDDGLGTAKDKTGQLADGLGKLDKGADRISKGAAEAATKARQLSLGARKVSDGTQQLADKVHGIARKDLPYLREHGREIGQRAQVVADLTQKLDEDLGKLPGDSAKAARQARENADNAAELYQDRCNGLVDTDPDCPKLKAIADGSALAADAAEKVNDTVAHTDFGQLRTKVRELHHGAAMVADEAPGIANRADKAIGQINQLNAGAHQVSQGAGLFADGIGTLADGAGKLHDGLGVAKDGADKLTGGLFKLKDGSNQLSDGLHSGVSKIPDYNKKDRDTRTEVMADPVELAAKSLHKAPNYGTGLAPYFIPLSLWVGAMVAFMLLQPLGKRALAAGAPGWRIALGSWLPAYAIGVVQVLALMAVLHWGLGLEMARTAGTVGFLLLATACFTAIIQLLGAFFGPAGRVLTLVVLMLQLTSAGGTYPVQTSPGFFAAIHPFLPMSYVVDGLRRLITGGDLAIVQQGCAVLAVFTVGALALTALAARSRQVVRMKDLHPELSL
ncbi:YhgE/Pip domain-containing protein [Streptomyces sp. RPA4-5]|uniref:YhgE/Pip domain-containing protein n=1 Tax=Streptomyces TaxID=1883 RepID=UPI00143E8F81|nr:MULTISPECIES: YhgE/Pip domain-containing protein [Streptomyces]MCX4634515.1 YhgE/Pip domain-containing protein [Streptomyces platensis]QIY55631.1 YhgE/Pip domain-containing protein [Streptomyces sp. RPA4-5]WJY38391.1 YhgE/Pip domain-containing protein [Streptomyces sp. P9-2B-2]